MLATRLTYLDIAQGNSEARTVPYIQYGEGALELMTKRHAESHRRVDSSADKQAMTLRRRT